MNLSKKELQELKNKKISIKELNDRYFINSKGEAEVDNILKLLNENICSFQQIVDKFKSIKNEYYGYSCLFKLFWKEKLFEELIESDRLTQENVRYLLNRLHSYHELRNLCENAPLIKEILNEFILNKKLVDGFNSILKRNSKRNRNSLNKEDNIHNIFELITYFNKNNEEILKLNELNKKIYTLNSFDLIDEQKLEIHEILRNNETARNRLIQIIDNHLEDQYDFESLKNLLTKDIEKKRLKMNF